VCARNIFKILLNLLFSANIFYDTHYLQICVNKFVFFFVLFKFDLSKAVQ
jgi:hypothetical protein